jgi:hypothetical protein
MSEKKVDRATPQIIEKGQGAEQLVTSGNDIIGNITASAALAGAPAVQAVLKTWATANANLDANNKSKAAGKLQLDTALANEGPLVRRWGTSKRAVLSAIEVAADGSAEIVQSFNVAVEKRQPKPAATVPANLRPMKVHKSNAASVRWDPTLGAKGYMLQHATNPSDATTYSPQIHVSESKYHFGGQTAGATIYFRVLALDASLPTGQTAFTAWVPVIVSA